MRSATSTAQAVADDGAGNSGQTRYQYVVAYDPDGGFVTGSGTLESPAGAYTVDPGVGGTASFGFVARYKHGATVPTGTTEFTFSAAGFSFQSASYDWLVVAGNNAKYKGDGMVNGVPGYRFMLTASDGKPLGKDVDDTLHLKVWDAVSGGVIYDNEPTVPEDGPPTAAILSGNIVVHK